MNSSLFSDKTGLLAIAAFTALAIVIWSFAKWRLAVMAAFVAVIFEGAIRKWLLPQGQEFVYFLKDILLLGAYIRFFFFPDPETRARTSSAPVVVMVTVFFIISLWALHPNIGSPILSLYGLKNYFYYLPLILMVPHLFRDEQHMLKILSWYSLVAIPVCLLGTIQFFAPSASILNVYAHDAATGEMSGGALMGAKQFNRITGTFSYISGMVTFVQIFTCISLSCIVSGAKRYQFLNSYIILPLLLAAGYMSGSRTAVFSQAFIITVFILAGSAIQLGKRSARALQLLLVLAVSAVASLYIFREAATAFYERAAFGSDALSDRLLGPIAIISDAMHDFGPLGAGVGVTHPACQALRRFLNLSDPQLNPQFESEPAQIMAELGIAGFLAWYTLRFVLISHSYILFRKLRPGPAKPLLLCVLILQLVHLMAQLVFNHTAGFLLWGLYGAALTPTLHLRLGVRSRRPASNRPSPSPAP